MCHTDQECVRLCLNGDPEMFRHLVLRYEVPLLKHLVGRLGNEVEAGEAAQETMVRAYSNLRSLKKAESFYAWLFGIANRVALESNRHNKRHVKSIDIETVADKAESCDGQSYRPDQALVRAIADLPEVYQQVILLRFYGDQSCAEISRSLNVSLGTVTSRLSRAYSLLRKALRKSTDTEQTLGVEL